jgi:tRNA-(ms[2]io[6]A)-hydroxylase
MDTAVVTDLPLRWRTPAGWAAGVLADPAALLNDHAHLERDAAANALALVRRLPDGYPADRWVARLTGVARDEVEHLALVSRVLARRDATLTRHHRNPYAAALREHVRRGDGPRDLADRLLVSGLIELRSCERFGLLAAAGHDLSPMYADLTASEVGHYRLFLRLAEAAVPATEVASRWDELLDAEASVAAAQAPGPRMHAGVAAADAGTSVRATRSPSSAR